MRPKLSGWTQRVISDKKLRKAKATAGTRLLPLTLATQTDASGHSGPGGHGIALHALTAWVPVDAGELEHMVDQLTAADWLTDTPPHRSADRPCPPPQLPLRASGSRPSQ
ncbi:hypothetical protein [Streptomyces olivaceoviridis]|uniref:hypothetical protein n=1 Tax=Streptomyces olivaceoviridis TaxID=1921 RepID=UPI0036F6E783